MKKFVMLFILSFLLTGISTAQETTFEVSKPIAFTKTRPLREITPLAPIPRDRGWKEGFIPNQPKNPTQQPGVVIEEKDKWNGVQSEMGTEQTTAPLLNFEGTGNIYGYYPPDTDGDVGMTHYVQMVNVSFQIFTKNGTSVYGPADNNTIWQNLPGPWSSSNDGDPIILYDQYAHRWVASQFALPNYPNGPFYEMVAVSETEDPTGAWYLYAFQFANMPDYPKLSVWPDGYYLSVNFFAAGSGSYSGTGVYAMERDLMLVGNPAARIMGFTTTSGALEWSQLPSDVDGPTLPPVGTPNYFAFVPYASSGTNVYVNAFTANWTTPANSTFSRVATIPVTAYDNDICSANRGQCIPQPGTSVKLESLTPRLMYRLQYRNFGTHQSMVACQTVDVGGTGKGGVRWYEFRRTSGAWTLYQEGTYSPDASHRWMGSIAMNGSGDIALGYSVSSSTVYPSIRYTGRYSNSPLGTMPITEEVIKAGTGSQTGYAARWGDYSKMSIDPADDQTFWYTTEYVQTTGEVTWQTRIAAFTYEQDAVGPAQITNLTATNPSSSTVDLHWTAVGDDGMTGTAYAYDIRYSTTGAITNANFNSATPVANPPAPLASGSPETFTVTGLTASTPYYFAVRVYDNATNYSTSNSPTATTIAPPIIGVNPTSLSATLYQNTTITQQLTITNTGTDALDFSFPEFQARNLVVNAEVNPWVTQKFFPELKLKKGENDPREGDPPILGAGGPDAFGYTWIDSDAPGGPTFNWVDISATGTVIPSLGDDGSASVTLPFQFPFYGTNYGTIYVSANGYFSFANSGMGEYTNESIPTSAVPNSLIAMMWDDLNPGNSGATSSVRYYNDAANNRFIISFINVIRYGSSSRYTAQLILYPNGTAVCQYLSMQGTYLSQMTIGIEDQAGAVGLQTVFDAAYMHDNLALQFSASPEFITAVTPATGTLLTGQSATIDVTYSSEGIDPDVYDQDLTLLSNDPAHLTTIIPNTLTVLAGTGSSIPFEAGWNIFSSAYTPPQINMRQFMDPLIVANQLIKVQNESGQALEFVAGNWINNIGNWLQTEGYYTKVTANTSLSFAGTALTGTINIPLTNGWNIMSYPTLTNQNALTVLNSLVTANQLVKVIDENGNPIENLPGIGWINLVGNFKTGEGYLIRVNANTSVNISTTSPANMPANSSEVAQQISESFNLKPQYFIVKQTGNPYRPMNLYVTGFDASYEGSEIGIYDGNLLVGSAVIGKSGIVPVVLGMDDPFTEEQDGFIAGNAVTVKYWDGSSTVTVPVGVTYSTDTESGLRFSPLASVVVSNSVTNVTENVTPVSYQLFDNYPNPFNPSTTLRYAIPFESSVKLRVFTMSGELVSELVNGTVQAGYHEISFNASTLASGVYFYALEAFGTNGKSFTSVKKMVLLK